MTATITPITSPRLAGVWATTKGLEVGDWVAKAVNGQPRLGPTEWREVTSIEQLPGRKALTLADGSEMHVQGATKIFIAKAEVAAAALPVVPGPEAVEAVAVALGIVEPVPPVAAGMPPQAAYSDQGTADAEDAAREAKASRRQAKAVRDADYAAKVAAEQATSPTRKGRKTNLTDDLAKANAAPAKATKAQAKAELLQAVGMAPATKARPVAKAQALAASPSMKSAAAARVGEDATKGAGGKALAGYVVRWPQAGYDVLVRTDAAKGDGPAWLARCNEHGATAPAENVKAAFDLARKGDGIKAWCPGHAAAAK